MPRPKYSYEENKLYRFTVKCTAAQMRFLDREIAKGTYASYAHAVRRAITNERNKLHAERGIITRVLAKSRRK